MIVFQNCYNKHILQHVQGGPKSDVTTFEGSLTCSLYVFKTPKLISIIFGPLQGRFILNTSVDSKFIKFIVQSGAMWQKLTTRISLQ